MSQICFKMYRTSQQFTEDKITALKIPLTMVIIITIIIIIAVLEVIVAVMTNLLEIC